MYGLWLMRWIEMNLTESRLKRTIKEGLPIAAVANFVFVLTYATSVGLNGLIGILVFASLMIGNLVGFCRLGKKNSNSIEIVGYSLTTFVVDIVLVSVLYWLTHSSFDKMTSLLSFNLGIIVIVNLIVSVSTNSFLKQTPILFAYTTKEIDDFVAALKIPKEPLFYLYNNNPTVTTNMINRALIGYPLDDEDIVKLIHIGIGYSELDSKAKNFVECKQSLRKMYLPIVDNYLDRTSKEIESELSMKSNTNESIISMVKEDMKED